MVPFPRLTYIIQVMLAYIIIDGSGKRLNDIEKGQIKAFKDLNLSISDISGRVNRSRKVTRCYLNDPENYGTKTSLGRPQKHSEREK